MRTFLIVDGHNFSYRILYAALSKPASGKYLDKKQDVDIFKQQLIVQFMNLLDMWKMVADGVVVAWDYGSWRKELLKREFEGEVEYKANRNTEEKVNMKRFTDCLGEFKSWLNGCKVVQCELWGAEGDDWICALSRKLNGRGDNAIIYSNDGDLHQLVANGIMQLAKSNDKYNFYVTPSDMERLTKNDAVNVLESMLGGNFTKVDTLRMLLMEMVAGKKLEIVPIEPQEVLFKKIMVGDKSDNIPSVCSVRRNNRTYGISEKMSDKILEGFYAKSGIDKINELCYSVGELSGMLCESIFDVAKERLKYEGTADDIAHNLERNIKYVVLGNNVMPASIADAMSAYIDANVVNGAYINWSAIGTWKSNNENATKKVEINGLGGVVGKGEKDTDWSFIKKSPNDGKLF